MAVNQIYWAQGEDIHVVAGAVSRTLDDLLWISHGAPPAYVSARNPPAGVTVRFRAAFNGALVGTMFSGFGVSMDQNTGAVTVANPLPGGHRLRNFLIHAEVRDTTVGPAQDFVQRIRIHIHAAVTNRWLTPAPLTIHQNSDGQRFAVFAQFDDDTVGDISRLTGLVWTSATPASISVDPGTGSLSANVAGASIDITVTLPAPYGGNATAKVESKLPWSTPVAAKLLPGSAGVARMNDPLVPNFLFLPDGFTTGEQALFETTVQKLVTFLRTSKAMRPFDLCSAQMNYWMAWIESRERGTSPRYEVSPITRGGKTFGTEVPLPDPPGAAALVWTLPQLIHEVGLPVPAHGAAGVTFAMQQAEWAALFGAGINAHVDAALFASWKALANRRIVNECDTALGLALGARPSAERIKENRAVIWHPLRTTRAHLDDMLANIRDAVAPLGPAIGAAWGTGGKDRSFVIVLCAGARNGGARTPSPNELIAEGLVLASEVEIAIVAGTRGFRTVPFAVGKSLPLDAMCTVAHESAHALTLGDEYGGNGTLPTYEVARVNTFPNLQDAGSASVAVPGVGIDPARLKWNWPRIVKAGVLDVPPQPHPGNPGSFRLVLHTGHGAPFAVGDIVRLRQRPLAAGVVPSPELELTAIAADELIVRAQPAPPFVPGSYIAGSVVYVQRMGVPIPPAVQGPPLGLISPTVLAHMAASGIPLNVPPVARGAHVCVPDHAVVQPALNKPAVLPVGLGHPVKWSAWIVGAFEGGMIYGCGVYHPTGACVMRRLTVPEASALAAFGDRNVSYSFCPVCQYVLVDRLDPTKHGAIDADYDERYAEP